MSNNNTAPPSFTDKLALGEAKRGDRVRRVVVTGGSGKLGRATVKYLSDEGWEVISVDTRRPQARRNRPRRHGRRPRDVHDDRHGVQRRRRRRPLGGDPFAGPDEQQQAVQDEHDEHL
jgi:nucleoside-diphosphate-sugar epimerase